MNNEQDIVYRTKLCNQLKTEFNLLIHPDRYNDYREVFTHASYANSYPNLKWRSYDRLEFLGDAVLGYCVTIVLYEQYPNANEGEMTNLRRVIISRDGLSEFALKHHLQNLILTASNNLNVLQSQKVLADIVEALIAAIYLDYGINFTKMWIKQYFNFHPQYADSHQDYKTILKEHLEHLFRNHSYELEYRLVSAPTSKLKRVDLFLNGIRYAYGEHIYRSNAEQEAAKYCYEQILKMYPVTPVEK